MSLQGLSEWSSNAQWPERRLEFVLGEVLVNWRKWMELLVGLTAKAFSSIENMFAARRDVDVEVTFQSAERWKRDSLFVGQGESANWLGRLLHNCLVASTANRAKMKRGVYLFDSNWEKMFSLGFDWSVKWWKHRWWRKECSVDENCRPINLSRCVTSSSSADWKRKKSLHSEEIPMWNLWFDLIAFHWKSICLTFGVKTPGEDEKRWDVCRLCFFIGLCEICFEESDHWTAENHFANLHRSTRKKEVRCVMNWVEEMFSWFWRRQSVHLPWINLRQMCFPFLFVWNWSEENVADRRQSIESINVLQSFRLSVQRKRERRRLVKLHHSVSS